MRVLSIAFNTCFRLFSFQLFSFDGGLRDINEKLYSEGLHLPLPPMDIVAQLLHGPNGELDQRLTALGSDPSRSRRDPARNSRHPRAAGLSRLKRASRQAQKNR